MKKGITRATSVLLVILMTLTMFAALPLGASAAEAKQSQTDVIKGATAKSIANCTITLSTTTYYYNGVARTPSVTVKDGSKTLTKGTDFTVAYRNNKNAGTATAVITGTGNYTNSVNKSFTINARSLSATTITISPTSYTYDGTAKKPTVTVKDGEKTLVKGADYNVAYKNNVNAGTATAAVTGIGNYTGTVNKSFTIKSTQTKSITSCTVTLSNTTYYYNGTNRKPTVTVKDGTKTLTKDTHFTVAYKNYKNAGTATVTVTGKGSYSGTVSKTYEIKPRSLSATTITLAGTVYNYNNTPKKPAVTVKDGDVTLKKDTDFTVTYKNYINAGTATAVVTGKGNYTGSVNKTYTIKARPLYNTTVSLSTYTYFYNGTARKPGVTVTDGDATLKKDTDFTVSYKNNTNAGIATATITGKRNYTGSVSRTFTIKPRSLSATTITISPTSYTYDGTAKKPTVTVKDGTKTLTKDTHFTVSYKNNTAVGTATAIVTGKGNYTGTINKNFTIKSAQTKSITSCTVTLSNTTYYYNGTLRKPTVTVKDGTKTLTKDTHFTVSYKNNKNAGTATVTVTGKGSYSGSVNKTFEIKPRSLSVTTVTLSGSSYTYDGTAKKPTVTVTDENTTLRKDTDYTLTYKNYVKAGTATAVLTGKGNYTGSVSKTYTIKPKSITSGFTITLSTTTYFYNSTARTPNVTVKKDDLTLTKNTDYTVTYKNNTNAGTATAVVTGKGNYTGTVNRNFTIKARSLSATTVTVSPTSYTYDGTAKKPTVTVKDGDKTLVKGTHYNVTYKNNVNVGTATAAVTGIGNYTGTVNKSFTIKSAPTRSISDCTVTVPNSSYYYTGVAITPTVTVKDGSTTLTLNTHYTVAYKNNTNVGTATATVTGKGTYSGTKSVTFKIAYETISTGSTKTVSISTAGRQKYYSFKPSANMKIKFYSTGSSDTYGYLYDANLNQLASNDNSGENNNFLITYSLTGGTTYIFGAKFKSTSSTGSFSVKLEKVEDTPQETVIKSQSISITEAGGHIDGFTYQAPRDMFVRFRSQGAGSEAYGCIRDSEDTAVDLIYSIGTKFDKQFSFTFTLKAGVTYLFLGGFVDTDATGSYTLVLSEITKQELSKCDIRLETNSYTYDGSQKKPTVIVMDEKKKLTLNTDYTVSYSNNVNVGVATVTVTGTGKYTGSVKKRFTILNSVKSFTWGRDNWNFTNSPSSFSSKSSFTYRELSNSTYLNALKTNLANDHIAYQFIFEGLGSNPCDLDREWGGSCYGMSMTQYLAMQGLISPKDYSSTATSINQLSTPVNDLKVNSLINYYMWLQRTEPARINERRVTNSTNEENIKEILSLLKTNKYVNIGINLGHEIAAYGVEYGNYDYYGEQFDARILISDPNFCSNYYEGYGDYMGFVYDYNIYFNTTTYKWIIPYYYFFFTGSDGNPLHYWSENGAKFNGITADLCVANDYGFYSYQLASNDAACLSARMNTYEASDDKTISKVARTTNGTYGTLNGTWDDIKESDFVLKTGGNEEPTQGYDLFDYNSSYRITQNEAEKLSASLEYTDCLLYAGSSAGTSAIFDKSGYVEINGAKSDYELTMVSNYDYATDWFSIDVKGTGAEKASLTMSKEGYIVTSDNLHNVKVRALNKDVTVNAAFSTDSGSVLIYEIDENTIGLRIDADGNGTYETELPVSGSTAQISGSSAQSTVVTTIDAAINENEEKINRAAKGKAK